MCWLMYTNCQRLSCPLLWLAELAHMSSSWPITGSGQLRRRESVRRRSNTKYCALLSLSYSLFYWEDFSVVIFFIFPWKWNNSILFIHKSMFSEQRDPLRWAGDRDEQVWHELHKHDQICDSLVSCCLSQATLAGLQLSGPSLISFYPGRLLMFV